jgi:hypothetical protein
MISASDQGGPAAGHPGAARAAAAQAWTGSITRNFRVTESLSHESESADSESPGSGLPEAAQDLRSQPEAGSGRGQACHDVYSVTSLSDRANDDEFKFPGDASCPASLSEWHPSR